MKRLIALITLLAFACPAGVHASAVQYKGINFNRVGESDDGFAIYRDLVIWIGADCPSEFKISNLKRYQETDYELLGLKLVEKDAMRRDPFAQWLLAGYHLHHSKCFRKALYWAIESAEAGETEGMRVLSHMYINGKGALTDTCEGIKWCILMVVLGDDSYQEFLNLVKKDDFELYEKATSSARVWMHAHAELFCSP